MVAEDPEQTRISLRFWRSCYLRSQEGHRRRPALRPCISGRAGGPRRVAGLSRSSWQLKAGQIARRCCTRSRTPAAGARSGDKPARVIAPVQMASRRGADGRHVQAAVQARRRDFPMVCLRASTSLPPARPARKARANQSKERRPPGEQEQSRGGVGFLANPPVLFFSRLWKLH